MAELSLWLDSYDDIYSDFDSRHYSKRRISEDFIDELRNALNFRTEKTSDLILLLPQPVRREDLEIAISASLKEQMHKRLNIFKTKSAALSKKGILLLFVGTLLLVISSFIVYKSFQSYWFVVLRVILEPAGWFMIWNGLESLFYQLKDMKRELSFYETLGELKIHFKTE